MPYTPPVYTTLTDFLAYCPSVATPEANSPAEDALVAVIIAAEHQVDYLLTWDGTELVQEATQTAPTVVRSLDPADISAADRYWLSRAVCAQAEYRLAMGEEFFVQSQYRIAKGPEFETTGVLPDIGRKTFEELHRLSRHIYRETGIAYAGEPIDEDGLWA